MQTIVNKLTELAKTTAVKYGDYRFFVLFLRDELPGRWDLLVSAPWIDLDKSAAKRVITAELDAVLTPAELAKLSRIITLDAGAPPLLAVVRVHAGTMINVHAINWNIMGFLIKDAHIIISNPHAGATQPPPTSSHH